MRCRELTGEEYAACFDIFRTQSSEWDAIATWLKQEFVPTLENGSSIDVLSVGSGTGDFDLVLITEVKKRVGHLTYTAIDPNREHNRIFRQKVEESRVRPDSFRLIPFPFEEGLVDREYDLIHLTHCLYYLPDRKRAIQACMNSLRRHGTLLVFHQTALGINELQREFMARVKGTTEEMFSSSDLLQVLDDLDLEYDFDVLLSDIDVTDIVRMTPRGEQLLSFFLECHIDDADPGFLQEITSFLEENCRIDGGKYSLFQPGGVFRIQKT